MIIGAACAATGAPTVLQAADIPDAVLHDLAPHGHLRAAMNYGNPVLTNHDPATGAPGGVAVALAGELGRQLGVKTVLVPYQEAGQVSKAVHSDAWDVAFLAIEPARAQDLAFTAPYCLIEGCYAVRSNAPLHTADDVDRPGIRIAVALGSAYDLYLTRTLQHAQLVRFATSALAVDAFAQDQLDVLANVKQPLQDLIASHPEWRLLDGRFMTIAQAMCMAQGHPAGAAFLDAFVARAKASGFVAAALRASGHGDVPVPAA